ncbi:Endonuclease/exonuclease/phosphatase [Absidia repens]|uniref:Endonuclease/exonuclease/phosphatase n=1 Tax=Absidia repens TaxID=90262 RepID=A0A1X2HZG2_9FUNG|nr:Endonuclease/exonuclease/phosphatase [Absidia repens]
MEQENDPLLLEENTADTHNTKTNGQLGKSAKAITSYWSGTVSSWKRVLFGSHKSRAASQEVQAKLLENRDDNTVDDYDIGIYEDDNWYADTTTRSRPSRLKRCMRYVFWFLCICIGVPLGLLLLIFIGYALAFRPPPVTGPPSITALERTNLTQPARLLTYNIFMRPPGVKNNENDYKNERLEHIIKTILPRYDVITFQEAFAFGNHRVDQLIDAAQRLGFGYIMSPRHGPWELAADGGLLLLSRFPILQADILEYPRGLHSDWLSYKGALHALIGLDRRMSLEGPPQEEYQTMVHIFTTHTQASYGKGGTRSQKDILMRLDQFARLHQFIYDTVTNVVYGKDGDHTSGDTGSDKASNVKSIPIIAMGDFNIDSVDHSAGSITDLPINSSMAYTMMMDVLQGNGIDGSYFSTDDHSKNELSTSGGQQKWFEHDWRLSLTDKAYNTFGYHPVTFGDYYRTDNGTILPAETVLTHAEQVLTVQSIDQLLYSSSPVQSSPSTNLSLSNVTIVKFLVSGQPYTQLSDHYGISCLLSL